MNKSSLLLLNLSIFVFGLDMLIYAQPDYLNLGLIILNLALLTISGVLPFLPLKRISRYYYLVILVEYVVLLPVLFDLYLAPRGALVDYAFLLFYYSLLLVGYLIKREAESVLLAFLAFTFLVVHFAYFGTDELAIDFYSAYNFIHGIDPYIPSSTADLYTWIRNYDPSFNEYYFGTPLTTGGMVTNLGYPALSFILEVPSLLLHFPPTYTFFSFYLLTVFAIYAKFRRTSVFTAMMPGILANPNFAYYPAGGVTDIVWVFFVVLSLIVSDAKLKGVLYGLAVSFKQTPWILLPFYILHMKREGKSVVDFAFYSLLVFLVINGYFIAISPVLYFKDILSPVTSPLLGIGFGPSILAFNGFFYVSRDFFTFAALVIAITEIYLFVKDYNYFRDKWTLFPYFAFFFMYRVLWNYLIYWPWLGFIQQGELGELNAKGRGTAKQVLLPVALSVMILVGAFAYMHYSSSNYFDSIKVDILKVVYQGDQVSCIVVNVSYNPGNGMPDPIYPQFRALTFSPMPSANGYLFMYNDSPIYEGWKLMVLRSPPGYDIPKGVGFQLQVYYGNLLSVAYFTPSQAS
ncbi:MAG: hypothetical protein TQ35_0003355 [Candidatus Aramenus sulfurataquae]|uniref:DUF2029 domain-containing protein n=3 Tax=Candidatus Aramenus sulfurataquae TaxID=1326980 RepID=A0AAE3K1H0_9CREN|nr:hypothetical protein [Candidatus Aramenus sulfurataquae]